MSARDLARELAGAERPWVLDVRQPGEREQSCIEASQHIPLGELPARAGEVPRDRRVVIQCAGGYRSSIAASILLRAGHEGIADLIGGLTAWQAAGLPCDPPVTAA